MECLLCSIVDVTAYLYFIGFAPLIYVTFLRNFFKYARVSFCCVYVA